MSRIFTARAYQSLIFAFLMKVARGCLFVPMGFGKTSAVLHVLLALILSGASQRVLVLAPLRVARSTWPDEVKKWFQFNSMSIRYIEDWTPEEKTFLRARAALQRMVKKDAQCQQPETKAQMALVDKLHPAAQKARLRIIRSVSIFTCNYDRLLELCDILGDKWPFDTVVCDESTRLKSFRTKQGGKRASALSEIAFNPKVRRWINLTGTPTPNGLADLWGQMWFVDRGSRLGTSFHAFQERWFGYERPPGGDPREVNRVPFAHSYDEIMKEISDVCFTLRVKDWFDVKEPIVNKVFVDLPEAAREKYQQFEREMFTEIEDMLTGEKHEVHAQLALVKTIKCLQLAAGAAYINGGNTEWVEVHDEKIQALASIVEEAAGAPVLVAYHWRSDLARLRAAFPAARELDTNPQTIVDWNAGRIPILLAHPASAGHGLSLQDGGNILVFFSMWWALENNQQILERIGPVRQMQSGHDRPVYVYHIIARRTADEMVLRRVEGKASVQEIFMDALNDFNKVAA